MTLISFIFLKNQIRPIRRLALAAEAFGRGQRVPYRVSGAAEVRLAGQAFLDMRNRIERQIEQRTLMLSGVSHDLRTPLTRLKLGLSLAGGGDEFEAMARDVDDMEQMLEEFLAFSRGDSLEQAVPADAVALAERAVADAPDSQDRIVLNLPEDARQIGQVALRPNAVRRALDNLLSNALRYGSRCRLTVSAQGADLIYTIEDDGPGIPASFRERALRPFERLDAARNQNRNTGVGLGLAIATEVANSHGGALDLGDSDDLGGLRVDFHLPR
jgi:two-component system, OmpR family, osmolarity sensor histidine kinase EnvZ